MKSKMENFNLLQITTLKGATFYLDNTMTVRQAFEKFAYHKFTVDPVLDGEGHYVTSLSEGDILRFIHASGGFNLALAEKTNILEIERYRPYNAVSVDATLDELYALALSQNFIPVVDDREVFIGIVKRRDVFIYLKKQIDNK